jgi:hypothetical protein
MDNGKLASLKMVDDCRGHTRRHAGPARAMGNKKAFPSCGKGRKGASLHGQVAAWRRIAGLSAGKVEGCAWLWLGYKKRPFPLVRKVFFAYNLPFSPPAGDEKHVHDNIFS